MVLGMLSVGCSMDVKMGANDGFLGLGGDDDVVIGRHDTGLEGTGEGPEVGFPFKGDGIFEVSLDLPPASAEGLVYNGDYVPGTLHVGSLQTEVGVKLKGSSTFDTLKRKPSFKMSFDAFTPRHRFLGMEHLTFNAMKFDKTMLREAVAYRVFNQLDVPSPRHGYAQLTINGEPYGLYSMIETPDEHLLSRTIPDDPDGNLYDTQFIASDLTDAALPTFSLQEGDPATAFADLKALVDALNSGNINDVLQTRFDYETTMNFLAADLGTGNYDGYSRNTNNYLLYHAPVTDRWYFIPWGQDTAFGGSGPLYTAVRARVTSACHADADCRAALEEHVRAMLDEWEADDLYGWAVATSEMILPACQADPRKSSDCDPDNLLDRLEDRPAEIRGEIGP